MHVAVVEEQPNLGGLCLNWGCIPTKAILSSAELFEAVKHGVPGLVVEKLAADYGAVIDASRKVADRLARGVRSLMKKNDRGFAAAAGFARGRGDRHPRRCGGLEGARHPRHRLHGVRLPGPAIGPAKRVLTGFAKAPSRGNAAKVLVVISGGAVGIEFAYAYSARVRHQVTVVEMKDQLPRLRRGDCEGTQLLRGQA
jgi:dihydrolipoamide dehydrogenase